MHRRLFIPRPMVSTIAVLITTLVGWTSAALGAVVVYTSRATWQAQQSFLSTDPIEIDALANNPTPYTTGGGVTLSTVSGGGGTMQVVSGGAINGSHELHFREFGPGIMVTPHLPARGFGFDYATSSESWEVVVAGKVVATLVGNTVGFLGFTSSSGPLTSFVLRSSSGVQGGISLDNLSAQAQGSRVLEAGGSVSLAGAAFLGVPCGGSLEYRWTLGGAVVRDWLGSAYAVAPASPATYLLEGRCAATPATVHSCLVTALPASSLGQATLTADGVGAGFTVGNIGSSGNDGVSLALPGTARFDMAWDDLDPTHTLPTGAFMEMRPFGTINGVANQQIGVTRAQVVGDSVRITADFAGIGSTATTIIVFNGGQNGTVVGSVSGITSVNVMMSAMCRDIHIEPKPGGGIIIDHTKRGASAAFVIAGHGTLTGDYLCLVPQSPTGVVTAVTSAKFFLKQIPSLHITDYSTTVVTGMAAVVAPLAGPWVVGVTCMLLTAIGLVMVRKRLATRSG